MQFLEYKIYYLIEVIIFPDVYRRSINYVEIDKKTI